MNMFIQLHWLIEYILFQLEKNVCYIHCLLLIVNILCSTQPIFILSVITSPMPPPVKINLDE